MEIIYHDCHIADKLKNSKWNGNLKKTTPDSAYLQLKTLKNEIFFQDSQKKHVRVTLSKKGLNELSQYAPNFEAFWTSDWMALSEFI